MTVNFDDTDEIEPTMALQITGARIEPWTSKMIAREQPAYLFTLQLSRPATPAEKIVFKELRGTREDDGYQLGEVSVDKLKLDGEQLHVGGLGAKALVDTAGRLEQLVQDMARTAAERTEKARVEWDFAREGIKSLSWSDGRITP